MSAGILFGKRTWVGLGTTIVLLALMLLLGALLIVRGLLPTGVASPWLWISYGLSAFIGGRIAAAGQGRKLCALMPGMMVYLLAWLLALCSECVVDFSVNGLGITIAVMIGAFIAFVGRREKKRSSRNRKMKIPSTRTLRR